MRIFLAIQLTDEREDILDELGYENRLFSYFYSFDKKHGASLASLKGQRSRYLQSRDIKKEEVDDNSE